MKYIYSGIILCLIIGCAFLLDRKNIPQSFLGKSQVAAIAGADSGLIGHWDFEEGSGYSLKDVSGNGNNGIVYNNPAWVDGKIGSKAVSFDGVDDRVDVDSNIYNFEASEPFSVFIWVKAPASPTSRGYDSMISRTGVDYYGWSFGIRGSNYEMGMGSKDGADLGQLIVSFPRGETASWHLVGFTYDGSRKASGVKGYVDGLPQKMKIEKDIIGKTSSTKINTFLQIGNGLTSSHPLIGSLDDARIYNRVITALEVGEIFALGGGVVTANAPVIKNNTAESFAAGTRQVTLTLTTTEVATCKYSTTPGVAYSAIPAENTFGGASTLAHSKVVTGLADGTPYTYYVRCQEDITPSHTVTTTDTPVSFVVRSPLTLPAGTLLINNADGQTIKDLPGSALWSRRVTNSPGDREKILVNPPIFTWQYDQDARSSDSSKPKEFVFQVDNNSDFSSPEVNVRTDINMYNYLAPFAAGTYYWRVGYLERGGSTIDTYGPKRSFVITADIPLFDRSKLADPAYLAEKAVHPHILINAGNRSQVHAYLEKKRTENYIPTGETGSGYDWEVGRGWDAMKTSVDGELNDKWWGEEFPEHYLFIPSNFNFSVLKTALKDTRPANAVILEAMGITASQIDSATNEQIIAGFKKAFNTSDLHAKVDTDSYISKFPTDSSGEYILKAYLRRARGNYADWEGPANPFEWRIFNIYLLRAIYPDGLLYVDKPITTEYRAFALRKLGFVRQLTQDPKYLSVNPGRALGWYARDFIDSNKWKFDAVSTGDYVSYDALSFAYDWFYHDMQESDRALIRKGMEMFASWNLYAQIHEGGILAAYDNSFKTEWRDGTALQKWWEDPLAYNGDYQVNIASLLRQGTSHTFDNLHLAHRALLSMYGELNPQAKKLFEILTQYIIAKGSPFNYGVGAISQGRTTYAFGNARTVLRANILLKTVFPEIAFEKNPYLTEGMDWWSRVWPAGMMEDHDAWGDGKSGTDYLMASHEFARDGALFTRDANIFKHWETEAFTVGGIALYPNPLGDLSLVTSFMNQTLPRNITNKPLSKVLISDGWSLGCSSATYSVDCFQKGVGFMFSGRPYGQFSHGGFGDLSYQLWAYGTNFTDAGGIYKTWSAGTNMSQYTIMVNGLGHVQTEKFSAPHAYLSRIFAFKTTPDYTYTAVDGTNLYPRANIQANWGADGSPVTAWWPLHSGGPLSALTKVHRHFLFVKNKYFVVVDDLASNEAYRFSSLFPVLENTVTFTNPEKTAFKYTSNIEKYKGRKNNVPDVNVHVAQIYKPSEIRVDDLNTPTTVYSNPFQSTLNFSDTRDDSQRAHTIWASNNTPSKEWKFFTIIFPQQPGTAAPIITRIDDYTAKVVWDSGSGLVTDIISFNSDTAASQGANIVLDMHDLVPSPVADDITGQTTECGSACIPPPLTTHQLTVAKTGDGQGTVSGATLSCGPTCTYIGSGSVTLTAQPVEGSTFIGWTGGGCSGTGSCTVFLSAPVTVTAVFKTGTVVPGPIISSINAASITSTSALVTWNTDVPATTQVRYGLTTAYGSVSELMTTLLQKHSVALADLTPNTTYNYRVISRNANGEITESENRTFTTAVGPAVSQPYTLVVSKKGFGIGTITSIGVEQAVNCGTSCSVVVATGEKPVLTAVPNAGSTFTGWTGGGCSGTGPCSPDESLITITPRSMNVTAQFQLGEDTVRPVVSVMSPLQSAALVPGTTTLMADATDNVAIQSVQFYVDGVVEGIPAYASKNIAQQKTFTRAWLARTGTHTITAVATDSSGNKATSSAIVVKVNSPVTPPVAPPPPVVVLPPANPGTTTPPIVITPTQTPTASALNRTLVIGDSGPDVVALQSVLKSKGYLTTVTAVYDTQTVSAVKVFQWSYNIAAPGDAKYGQVEATTRAKVNSLLATTPIETPSIPVVVLPVSPTTPVVPTTSPAAKVDVSSLSKNLSQGDTHSQVKVLQRFLNSKGYIVAKTGNGSPGKETTSFGKSTKEALIKFQKDYGISPPTGNLGPLTRAKIKSL